MENIKINVKNIDEMFKEGLESTVYYYNDLEKYKDTVLYKRFKSIEHIRYYYNDISKHMLENKREKLDIISKSKCFNEDVKILDAGIENRKFSGYTMLKSDLNPIKATYWVNNKYNKKYLKPNGVELTLDEKIKYLKLIREKIELLNKNKIYIGNFNYDNFLVSDDIEKLQLCDLDNFRIGKNDFDSKTDSVKNYENVFKNENVEGLDSYCFNIFTLAILYDKSNFTILRNLEDLELPRALESSENYEILESIKKLDKSYKPKFLIDKYN